MLRMPTTEHAEAYEHAENSARCRARRALRRGREAVENEMSIGLDRSSKRKEKNYRSLLSVLSLPRAAGVSARGRGVSIYIYIYIYIHVYIYIYI